MSTESQTAGTNANDTGTTAPAAPAEPAAAPVNHDGGATPSAEPTAPAAGEAPKPEGSAEPTGAPEAYADFAMPENVKVNEEIMTEFKTFAKEKNLSQEDAQKLADFGSKITQNVAAKYAEQAEAVKASWEAASKTDKEFGGDALPQNLATAKKAIEAFGTPELSKLLNESGLGNHPEVIRTFYRVGKSISEDRLVPGGTKTAGTDPAKTLFPNMN